MGYFLAFVQGGSRGVSGFHPNPPNTPPPPPLYTPMQPFHMMDYNESGAWRPGVGRNGEEANGGFRGGGAGCRSPPLFKVVPPFFETIMPINFNFITRTTTRSRGLKWLRKFTKNLNVIEKISGEKKDLLFYNVVVRNLLCQYAYTI